MGFSGTERFAAGASRLALGLAAHAVVIGALCVAVIELILHTHLYATVLVLGMAAILAGLRLTRTITRADRMLQTFLGGIVGGAIDRPAGQTDGFPALTQEMRRAADSLEAARATGQRRIDTLDALLDTVSAALFVVDVNASIILANRAARALVGEAVTRFEDAAVLGPETRDALHRMQPGTRLIVRLADGRRMLALAAQFVIPDSEPRRLVSLQSLVGDLDIVEQQAWRDLAQVLAHEMMNSLTPISSLAESLGDMLRADGTGARTAEVAEAVEVIARRSTGLMSFVGRYRQMAELPTPNLSGVTLADFVADVERLLSPSLRTRDVRLTCAVTPMNLAIMADPDLLQQAVINLVKNAADAVEGLADPRVDLSCSAEDGEAVIRIADLGRGLPSEEPDRIFVPFFTTKATGSGIGLSLARQIALAHQGRLTVRPNHPQGAIFELILPIA